MAITSFAEPIFDADVRLVNFFNGRMLSAEDLSREQDANREERRRLGRAIGNGVAYGLEVTPTVGVDRATAPAVTISAGLAVNRRGQTLALASSVDLLLKQPPSATASTTSDIQTFAVCDPLDTNAYVAGAGAYLLTIGEAKGKQGLAPVSGLGNIQASCNTKYLVPGVRFRLIPLTLESTDLNEPDLLRNKLAYRCLAGGPQATDPPVDEGFFANLFGPPITEYGVIDRLRPHLPESALTGTWLKECEVPLALLYLTATNGLVFVDMWSVRRRIIAPSADSRFPLLTGDRRLAEGEAMFLQFRRRMLDLASALNNPQGTRAVDYFSCLPPSGRRCARGQQSLPKRVPSRPFSGYDHAPQADPGHRGCARPSVGADGAGLPAFGSRQQSHGLGLSGPREPTGDQPRTDRQCPTAVHDLRHGAYGLLGRRTLQCQPLGFQQPGDRMRR